MFHWLFNMVEAILLHVLSEPLLVERSQIGVKWDTFCWSILRFFSCLGQREGSWNNDFPLYFPRGFMGNTSGRRRYVICLVGNDTRKSCCIFLFFLIVIFV